MVSLIESWRWQNGSVLSPSGIIKRRHFPLIVTKEQTARNRPVSPSSRPKLSGSVWNKYSKHARNPSLLFEGHWEFKQRKQRKRKPKWLIFRSMNLRPFPVSSIFVLSPSKHARRTWDFSSSFEEDLKNLFSLPVEGASGESLWVFPSSCRLKKHSSRWQGKRRDVTSKFNPLVSIIVQ